MHSSEPGTHSALSPSQQDRLLACARRLLQAQRSGEPLRALRGRNLCLLCEPGDSEGPELFRAACNELGARVATIHPSADWRNAPQEVVAQTALVLGRLYDAVECQGLAPETIAHLRANAGVPVLDAAALPDHPSSTLSVQLGPELPLAERRRYLLEATILEALGLAT